MEALPLLWVVHLRQDLGSLSLLRALLTITSLRLISTGSVYSVIPKADPFFSRPELSHLMGADPGRRCLPAPLGCFACAEPGRNKCALLCAACSTSPFLSSPWGVSLALRNSRSRFLCISRLKSSCSARSFPNAAILSEFNFSSVHFSRVQVQRV